MNYPKEEIIRTENCANRVTLAKDNINSEIISLGGVNSDTLSDVPANLRGIVSRQGYTRLAEGDHIQNFKVTGDVRPDATEGNRITWKEITIPLNLSFVPKRILISWDNAKFFYRYDNLTVRNDEIKHPSLDSSKSNTKETAMGYLSVKDDWKLPMTLRVYASAITKESVTLSTAVIDNYRADSEVSETNFTGPFRWVALG